MEDYSTVKEYIKRLKRLVNNDCDFSFMQYRFVKVKRVEDLLTCILAAVPESYRKALKMRGKSLYRSVVAYNTLSRLLRNKFFLLQDFYMVDSGETNLALDTIMSSIETDINNIEELD